MNELGENAKTLKAIELNTAVASDQAEQWLPRIKEEVQLAHAEIGASVKSIRGVLQAILGALVVIALILLAK